ncbi:transcription factor bHLH110 isoform X1 [Rhodamnia argentea]|uniref:Transcription factor bHLH110 isoform X1 n=1 Tax=Rhodamnia argentea TaxID=178133 RepID=A0A8B8N1Z5_9MYRT|nr:transcription factor bHLH110 isoform X1 [Rhodamnia argentea]
MEPANLHHQYDQFQDHHAGSSSSSSLDSPSCYGSVDNSHSWTRNTSFLNATGNFSNSNVIVANSRTDSTPKHGILNPLLQSSSIQIDLGSHWTRDNSSVEPFGNNVDLAYGVKEELSDSLRFTNLLNSAQTGIEDLHLYHSTRRVKNTDEETDDLSELSQKLMLKTLTSTCQINLNEYSPGQDFFYPSAQHYVRPGIFSQIHPSIDVSNLSRSRGLVSSSLDINSPAFDLLNGRFSGSVANTTQGTNLGMHRESLTFDLQQTRQSAQHHDPISPVFTAKTTEAKRPSSSLEPNKTSGPHHQVAPKKTRVDQSTRAASAPFKVRKEKLGDRIAALQQLVAPFGKTDTASVLMEAIGYIKFLQNQVQTLSVPYMKPSHKEANRSRQQGPREDEDDEQMTRDLKSRGLCLVPLSCMSYVAAEGGSGGGIWRSPAAQLPQ